MNQFGAKPGLVKLYLRIGEVAELVGVQPHVLRYWEMEFRGAIRPQKSKKGQRVYSRQDVERLLKVKDLLRNQGFTIAGARKVLREGVSSKGEASPATAAVQATAAQAMQPEVVRSVTPLRPVVAPVASPVAVQPTVGLAPTVAVPAFPAGPPAVVWTASEEITESVPAEPEVQSLALSEPKSEVAAAAERAPMFELVLPSAANSDRSAKRLRRALVDLRQDVVSALKELS
ncbi:MAG TPA: MerR family transcriptional regulator [Polyangiaceae bacterium]|nr:MerR family transcriptional regulator [Polyangiaceae bacterium]